MIFSVTHYLELCNTNIFAKNVKFYYYVKSFMLWIVHIPYLIFVGIKWYL